MSQYITVFTPVYNRAYCLDNLYESLKRQTFINFEWVVIDDGSTDHVELIINKWKQENRMENRFPIRFERRKNGGKMRAVNRAVQMSEAPAFFIIDSDDYILDHALETIWGWFLEIKDNPAFAGVSGLRRIKTIDAQYNFDYVDATNLERRKYNLIIDMAECYKTEVLRQYPAPEIENETYISESIIWNAIAKDGLKLRWYNQVIYISEYRSDGLSAMGPNILKKNPLSWGKVIQLDVNCKRDEEFTEFQYYLYYETLKDRLSLEEMAGNLAISQEELGRCRWEKPRVIKNINEFLNVNKIKKAALYGLGGEAKRFLELVKHLDLEIVYGIDRNPNKLLPVCYRPKDDFPKADAIMITNRAGISEIKDGLKQITAMKCISIQEDILDKGINYYFSDI